MLFTVSNQSKSYLGVFGNYVAAVNVGNDSTMDKNVDSAFFQFTSLNPTWVNACFDQDFINQTVKPMVKTMWQRGRTPTALDISMAWDQQFKVQNFEERQKNLAELTAVLKPFVARLRQKLG